MNTSNIPGPDEHLFALHTITTLSLDPGFPLFRHYPAMKLGVRESVAFFARELVPLARQIMARHPETTEWVVTAPPLYVIPAGANLIAWEVSRLLGELLPGRVSVRSVDLHYALPNPQSFQNVVPGGEYSRSGIAERVKNRQGLHEGKWAPRLDPADFRGRAVLFINDINVTGTQQEFMQRTLEAVHPASIDWLYVIQVDPPLGRSNPEVEYALNHLNLATFEDFAEIVAGADIDYTSRCTARLLSYPHATLEPMLRSLDETRRMRLRELVTEEGAYTGEEYREKVALLF